ncbi:hypothetical protein [Hymenobacter wooponensis]|uniref:Biopolymer transporter ExbD n=1 Tax=Hymenobacter wooponensis TaxID=1525360 RepID=A0A4Z0MTP9_9BACT|nr:hypothetical protein [Hymenobacter wooponensis]TGD82800.1 hypothetical protein EU557_03190 [Hymenobacter wooponensis]
MAIFSHRRHHVVGTPRGMTCYFFCVLLLVLCYMLAGRLNSPFADPYVRLPTISSSFCYRGLEHPITISLDANNHIFLQADEEIQSSLIRQVAEQHGIYFTTTQLSELDKTPYLGHRIEELPQWLSTTERERRSVVPGLSNVEDLGEYIAAGLQITRQQFGRSAYLALRADKSIAAPQIQSMIRLFQQHGFNRIYLIVEE